MNIISFLSFTVVLTINTLSFIVALPVSESLEQLCQYSTCTKNKTIKLEYRDCSSYPVIDSDLIRTDWTASRVYTWGEAFPRVTLPPGYDQANISIGSVEQDFMPPQSVLDALVSVAQNQTEPDSSFIHRYTDNYGHPRMQNAIARLYATTLAISNPEKEIFITVGASGALHLAMMAFLNHGDEVIVFEPFYPDFWAHINLAGAKMILVPLIQIRTTSQNSNDWSFDKSVFWSKINSKTKMILFNNPNNPYGKAFNLEEIAFISQLAIKYNLIVVSDEAQEWFYYDKPDHIRIASMPGMNERTITISSGNKMFFNVGWRIGWAIGPENLIWAMNKISTPTVISVSTPIQIAFAMALETELKYLESPDQSYWVKTKVYMNKTMNRLVHHLRSVGADFIVPTSGFSIIANFTKLAEQIDLSHENYCRPGMRFISFLQKNGLNPMMGWLYFGPSNKWRTEYVIRLTNFKSEKIIDEFGTVITKIFKKVNY